MTLTDLEARVHADLACLNYPAHPWVPERRHEGNAVLDVLIIGAGLSGIGTAHFLQERCPGKTYAILEAREAIGGTWDLFRYPGIRSDSDMHTLGYRFRPWTAAKSIADGESILQYVRDTAREAGIDGKVRFGHRVMRASSLDHDDLITRWPKRTLRSMPASRAVART